MTMLYITALAILICERSSARDRSSAETPRPVIKNHGLTWRDALDGA